MIVIVQIEDVEGDDNIGAIVRVDIDAMFIGRADMTIAYGAETLTMPWSSPISAASSLRAKLR